MNSVPKRNCNENGTILEEGLFLTRFKELVANTISAKFLVKTKEIFSKFLFEL